MRARVGAAVIACVFVAAVARHAPSHAQSGAAAGAGQSGFTCCNFHPRDTWMSDANWFIHPLIPAGTPARVVGYGDYQVSVDIGGRAMTLALDYGRRQNLREWAQRMIVAQNPKDRIAGWPEAVRDAIGQGKVALGMTKEQVIVSVGYPPAHATPSLDSPQWKYWYDTHGTYNVVWDDAGRVKEIVAPTPIRFRVLIETPVEQPPAAGGGPVQLKDLEGLLPQPGGERK